MLSDMVAQPGEGAVALVARYAQALDRTRVTNRFFVDFRAQRARVANAWSGLPAAAKADREQLALLFLCRLMFLYFLQREGHLAGDDAYVPHVFERWRRRAHRRSFFRTRLDALFFGALNMRPAARSVAAKRLGDLPYLNGGLFERTALECRYPGLDLDDAVVAGVFDDLLDRYRFDSRDSAAAGIEGDTSADIDPEMLGRVFEGVMAAPRRGDTGTFFTPAAAVDRLVADALEAHLRARSAADSRTALRDIRVLDPACGSGAFLLGALSHIAARRLAAGESDVATIRRDIVARSLHGVDTQSDAALLCALRLWLALAVTHDGARTIEPLPNLDRRIRQGDALIDPLDVLAGAGDGRAGEAVATAAVRAAARSLEPLALRYVTAEPAERPALHRALLSGEAALARAWLSVADRALGLRIAELREIALQRDLWGNADRRSVDAAARATRLETDRRGILTVARNVDDAAALPFFSFAVHFPDAGIGGFDLVLMNPPWVRAHRWPPAMRRLARSRYRVCREPGWPAGAKLAGAPVAAGAQVDLSLLFVERSLGLLATGGTLGAMIPAKTFRSLYGGATRSMLLRETRLDRIDDHGLDHHSVFTADAFAGSIVATRVPPTDPLEDATERNGRTRDADARIIAGEVCVRLHRRTGRSLEFRVPQRELPLERADARSPWLLAPPDAAAAFRRMQAAGSALGSRFRVRRGVFTGANDVLLVREAAPRIGGLAWIRAEGRFAKDRRGRRGRASFEGLVESAALAPIVRGAGVDAWRYRTDGFVVWSYDRDARFREPPARLGAWLGQHSRRLDSRTGRPGAPAALFRVTKDALGAKVVWHDLSDRLQAVAVPASIRTPFGRSAPVVPLNTVYFIPAVSDDQAMLLAAVLNSLPVGCFARTIAERAKDARFRFFAWVAATLPVPSLEPGPATARLATIAAAAHEAGCIDDESRDELDQIVARLYKLDRHALAAIRSFDEWLSGRTR
jgi:hypothetical protein